MKYSVLAVIANYPPTPRSSFPMIVGKAPSAVVGPYDDIILPDPARLPLGHAYVVPEPELAIVTLGTGRHLTHEQAAQAIAGYCVAQDITERFHEFGPGKSPWTWEDLPAKTLGKSLDTFCPLGPALVTLDELQGDGALDKKCWINDEIAYDLPRPCCGAR